MKIQLISESFAGILKDKNVRNGRGILLDKRDKKSYNICNLSLAKSEG